MARRLKVYALLAPSRKTYSPQTGTALGCLRSLAAQHAGLCQASEWALRAGAARSSQRKWVGYMPSAELRGVTLDCDDPQSLARFYQELTGMTVGFSSDEYVALSGGSGTGLGFQGVENYRAPQWPDQQVPQQLHLDFAVEDLDAAVDWMLSLGATRPEHQPGGDRYCVLLDPAGHPFCLLAS